MNINTVAVPSNSPGGLNAELSEHFGHCEIFTLIMIEDDTIKEVSLLPNIPHEQGGCMMAVNHLKSNGVNSLLAGGMGMRPLVGFNSSGIEVFHNNGISQVGQAINAFIAGQLPKFGQNQTCGGGAHHHH